MSLAFAPGFPTGSPRFLGRFLSPVADGVAAHYVRNYTQPGDLVLDPFGQSPSVAVEALSLARRVIVSSSNPILRLALSLAVRPPALGDLKAALTALGDARIGPGPNDRLEVQVKAMYATTCAECGTPTIADAFDWDAAEGQPIEKYYVCLQCGGPRQATADDDDRALARRFGRSGPDYHLLLSRTVAPDDSDRGRAEDTLAVYPARTLAAIAILVHKLESVELDRATRRLLAGLLVAAFDATTTLAQERPKVLAAARRYREVNVWLALESALGILAGQAGPDRSTTLEALLAAPAEPAIYAHAGPMRELAARLPPGMFPLILSAPPRPNQAFWALSATWAAWLWGLDAVESFRGSLQRRRYDWTWHARALHQPLAAAQPLLAPGGRLICLLGEAEPGFNASLLAAASGAGYHLRAGALRADTAEAQLEFETGQPTAQAAREPDQFRAAREAAASTLRARGEPSRWASLHFAAWCELVANRLVAWDAADPLVPANRALEAVAADTTTFQRLGDSGGEPGAGLWWLTDQAMRNGPPGGQSLSDRVEAEVLRCLTSSEAIDEHDVLGNVYETLPGALTPGRALVMACLTSYARRNEAGLWQLRPEDMLEARSGELQTIQAELRALAGRNGFDVIGGGPQEWREDGRTVYVFAVLASAAVGPELLGPARPARRRFLVLPGGRAGLLEFKLRRDPRLREALAEGQWTIVKFRQVRRMLADQDVTRATLEPALAGDPIEALQQLVLPERGDE